MFARNSLRLISHSGLIKAIEARCSYVWMLDDLDSQANTTKTSLPTIKSMKFSLEVDLEFFLCLNV